MKTILLLAVLITCSSAIHAQPSAFDKYIESIKNGRESEQLLAFTKQCGIPQTAQRRFAFGNGKWEATSDLPKMVYHSESDSLRTVEVWFVAGKPILIITWVTDAYLAQEQISCLRGDNVAYQVVHSWSCDRERCDQVVITRELDKKGDLIQRSAEFVSSAGVREPLTPQVIDKEGYEFSTGYPDNRSLKDFNLPPDLLESQKAHHATP